MGWIVGTAIAIFLVVVLGLAVFLLGRILVREYRRRRDEQVGELTRLASENPALRGTIAELEAEIAELKASEVEVVFGEKDVREACKRFRPGAELIKAIWCADYAHREILRYFQDEGNEIKQNKDLEIHRIINPQVIDERAWQRFRDLWSRSEDQDRWKARVNENVKEFESFVVKYPAESGRSPVGIVIINNVGAPKPMPTVGFILDPNRNLQVGTAVDSVERWFDNIFAESDELTPEYVSRWDYDVAQAYDQLVWLNQALPPFFLRYRSDEQDELMKVISKAAEESDSVALVEVGCGTARLLLESALALSSNSGLRAKVQHLIGFDSSNGMIKKAQENLSQWMASNKDKTHERRALEKISLCVLDAELMNLHFSDGAMLPTSDLNWLPPRRSLDRGSFNRCKKVICCMLNTLGVIPDHQRQAILERMARAMGVGDYLVVSFLDGAIFPQNAKDFYTIIKPVTRSQDGDQTFDEEEGIFRVAGHPGYFSRWFFLDADSAPSGRVEARNTVNGMFYELARRVSSQMRFDDPPFGVTSIDGAGHVVVVKRTA